MTKYAIKPRGHGKYRYYIPMAVSESEAKRLEAEGYEICNSRREAEEKIRSKK